MKGECGAEYFMYHWWKMKKIKLVIGGIILVTALFAIRLLFWGAIELVDDNKTKISGRLSIDVNGELIDMTSVLVTCRDNEGTEYDITSIVNNDGILDFQIQKEKKTLYNFSFFISPEVFDKSIKDEKPLEYKLSVFQIVGVSADCDANIFINQTEEGDWKTVYEAKVSLTEDKEKIADSLEAGIEDRDELLLMFGP